METVGQTFSGSADADKTVVATVSRNGDLVGRMYVTSTTTGKSGGSALVSSAEVEIGGQKIDKQTAEFMNIMSELSTPESKAAGLKAMTGDVGVSGGSGVNMVQVPLQFWFNRNPGLALPLIALQYHEVKVKIVLGDSTTGAANAQLDADYIYLDTDERRRFAQVSHEYLIEQVQEESAKASNSQTLNFNHPVKEIIWTNTNTYTDAKIVLNGHDRLAAQREEYYQLRQPMNHHTAVPGQNVPVTDRPVMVAPINTGILTQHATAASVSATAAKLEVGQITIAVEVTKYEAKVGDVLQITVSSGGDSDLAAEVLSFMVTISVVTGTFGADDLVCEFVTVDDIEAAALPTSYTTGDGLRVVCVGRTQDPVCRTSQMTSKINCYSFALKPEEHQPSGTCNFSRIDNAKLVTTDDLTADDNIYAVNYNVLRVMSGMGGLAYSN
tara:strand:- start:62 stop:1381 length:1320 start_codon:yes stop_codon:yes gene_type:complete